MDSKSLYILWHLGLGDALLCNGLVRWYANLFERIWIPAYAHNVEAVRFMFSDLKHVEIVPVKDSADAVLRSHGKKCLKLGYYADGSFDPKIFDQEFYRQADVPFDERWKGFKLPDLNLKDIRDLGEPFAFVHDDAQRDFKINYGSIDLSIIVNPDPKLGYFGNIAWINKASEIHCINSSFLILVDSLPEISGQKLFLHWYARATDFPTLRKSWKIISECPERLSSDIPAISQVGVQ